MDTGEGEGGGRGNGEGLTLGRAGSPPVRHRVERDGGGGFLSPDSPAQMKRLLAEDFVVPRIFLYFLFVVFSVFGSCFQKMCQKN